MKVQAEISYILEGEPDVFKSVEKTQNRVVYVWGKKRAYLIGEFLVKFHRISTMTEEPQNGFMEVWSDDNDDMSDPPPNVDDNWIETYKTIAYKNYTLEWHHDTNMLRFGFQQNLETLKEQKIVAPIVKAIGTFGLDFPNQPVLNPR